MVGIKMTLNPPPPFLFFRSRIIRTRKVQQLEHLEISRRHPILKAFFSQLFHLSYLKGKRYELYIVFQ